MRNGIGKGGALLALDCSLKWTNAAVLSLSEGDLLAAKRLDIGRRQAAELPLVVEDLLAETGRSFEDLGLVAVTNGPGYFTGIRVGVSYGAALAYGLGLKIAPVSTLHMLAFSWLPQVKTVLVVVYAGRERLYAASFGNAERELAPGKYSGEELAVWLDAQDPESAILVSDEPAKTSDSLPGRRILHASPDAAVVAKIAWNARETTPVFPTELFQLTYVIDPALKKRENEL
ncbi:MAG: tRNA (adenosine(37)-N6)-threonylcarbamoyltransferase complex dimerization subunit type 1 TsaB [Synergistaceae bacterium]|jgi:tRNA threonylcarbamoyladenosine biosynthesis protein TsaB|nr:tRNA (adenosine(37)-N6)-threonylcarbamoyltransferase complex dimerization subunit type 1 TsaB [Synergistaceae bacterium]